MPARVEVVLSDEEREVLERWARRPKTAQALALRCRIVLVAADGESSKEIAAGVGRSTQTVGRWRAALPGVALMGCRMSRTPASRARAAMRTSSG